MDKKCIRAVIFDIDGTLSPDISWTKITETLGASVPHHLEIYEQFKTGILSQEEGEQAILKLWRGGGELHKSRLEHMFTEWTLKPDAIPVFQSLKVARVITCLITGSVDLFAEMIAERVKADDWYANAVLAWDERGNLSNINYEIDATAKKLGQFQEFCEKHEFQPTECVVVGDDTNDEALFRTTGRGIAVESLTSSVLDPVAWRKVKTLSEISGILGIVSEL